MSKKKFLWTLVLLVGAAGPLSYMGYLPMEMFTGDSADAATADSHGSNAPHADTYYLPIDPPFVVNFTHLGALRYLQISVEVMYPERELLERVKTHMPAIRNGLILLLSDQPYEKLSTLTGKEELRDEMVAAVNQIIFQDEAVRQGGAMFITNFVMQ